ncbi:hypothetical protein B0H16DRAFT_1777977, partial [Mycena metata]
MNATIIFVHTVSLFNITGISSLGHVGLVIIPHLLSNPIPPACCTCGLCFTNLHPEFFRTNLTGLCIVSGEVVEAAGPLKPICLQIFCLVRPIMDAQEVVKCADRGNELGLHFYRIFWGSAEDSKSALQNAKNTLYRISCLCVSEVEKFFTVFRPKN